MKQSTDRLLTTHTGSLPRPPELAAMLIAKETGEAYDPSVLSAQVRLAVAEVVRKQVEVGLDIVNDGEMSKFFYATYIKDRLSGFAGESLVRPIADARDFPEYATKIGVRVTFVGARSHCTANGHTMLWDPATPCGMMAKTWEKRFRGV